MTAPRAPVEPLARVHTVVTACSGCPELRYDSANFYECAKLGRSFKAPGKPTAPPAWCPLPLYPATLATPLAVQATDERELLKRCRDGFMSEGATGRPVLEAWRVETLRQIDEALAARAQLAQAPAALTEGQINALTTASEVYQYHPGAILEFVRAIERAHGISHKEKDE